MSARHTAVRLATTGIALLLAFGSGTAAHAADPDAHEPSLVTPVLDVLHPAPDGMPEGYYSDKERIDSILGLTDFPGGPYGTFPQPPNPRDPKRMPGNPGWGVQGIVGNATGVNPRPAGTDVGQDSPSRTQIGPVLLPICDSPDPCPLTPLLADEEPKAVDPADVLAERAAGLERVRDELGWWLNPTRASALDPSELPNPR